MAHAQTEREKLIAARVNMLEGNWHLLYEKLSQGAPGPLPLVVSWTDHYRRKAFGRRGKPKMVSGGGGFGHSHRNNVSERHVNETGLDAVFAFCLDRYGEGPTYCLTSSARLVQVHQSSVEAGRRTVYDCSGKSVHDIKWASHPLEASVAEAYKGMLRRVAGNDSLWEIA